MQRRSRTTVMAVAASASLLTWLVPPLIAEDERPPAGVEQLLPRGGIPAVFEPEFVTAAEAKIADDAWVFGVYIDGVAKAYSLNLLNEHEVVNDSSGDTKFAAVW